jgi:Zn-finger nucleic acid-binding protein
MERVEFKGMMLDVCPKCAGVWFDDIELRELIEKDPKIMSQLENAYAPNAESAEPREARRSCPRGHAYLETFRYLQDEPLLVDSCPVCYGVFLDNEEIGDVADYVRNEYKPDMEGALEGLRSFEGHTVASVGNQNEEAATYGLIHALSHWRGQKGATLSD